MIAIICFLYTSPVVGVSFFSSGVGFCPLFRLRLALFFSPLAVDKLFLLMPLRCRNKKYFATVSIICSSTQRVGLNSATGCEGNQVFSRLKDKEKNRFVLLMKFHSLTLPHLVVANVSQQQKHKKRQ